MWENTYLFLNFVINNPLYINIDLFNAGIKIIYQNSIVQVLKYSLFNVCISVDLFAICLQIFYPYITSSNMKTVRWINSTSNDIRSKRRLCNIVCINNLNRYCVIVVSSGSTTVLKKNFCLSFSWISYEDLQQYKNMFKECSFVYNLT